MAVDGARGRLFRRDMRGPKTGKRDWRPHWANPSFMHTVGSPPSGAADGCCVRTWRVRTAQKNGGDYVFLEP